MRMGIAVRVFAAPVRPWAARVQSARPLHYDHFGLILATALVVLPSGGVAQTASFPARATSAHCRLAPLGIDASQVNQPAARAHANSGTRTTP